MLRLVTSIRLRTLRRAGVARSHRAHRSGGDGRPPAPRLGFGALVTIVARECPTYTSITANRARNDIQESLRDLGADTPYAAGEPIDPDIEADSRRTAPRCRTGASRSEPATSHRQWPGHGASSRSSPALTTSRCGPTVDAGARFRGRQAGRTIAGATTIELTWSSPSSREPSQLWIQGGTRTTRS